MMTLSALALVERLQLEPHPEGGFYKETYRSKEEFSTSRGARLASTAILFLVTRGNFSSLHRIKSDEVWHFYQGAPLRVVSIFDDGRREDHVLGNDILKGQVLQAVVPAGAWFGALMEEDFERVEDKPKDFVLVGCTVSPGFVFEDFEIAKRVDMLRLFPQHADIVTRLTRV